MSLYNTDGFPDVFESDFGTLSKIIFKEFCELNLSFVLGSLEKCPIPEVSVCLI